MKDKMYLISGSLAAPFWQGDKFVVFDDTKNTWVLDEQRWFNFCHNLANRGVNLMRWLGWTVWEDTGKKNLTPFLFDENGKYILSSRNDKYWEIIEKMIKIANYPSQKTGITAPGITIWIDMFFQYYNDKDDQKRSPWRNNTIGTTSLYDPANWPYTEAYMLEWFKLSKEKGCKIVYGMGNEMEGDCLEFGYNELRIMDRERIFPFSWGVCPEVPASGDMELFKNFPMMIAREGLFKWYQPMPNFVWDTSIIRPAHSCGDIINGVDIYMTANGYWNCLPIRWVGSDDGVHSQAGPDGRPDAKQWDKMVTTLVTWRGTDALTMPWNVEKPIVSLEHLPDGYFLQPDVEMGIFEAMGVAYGRYLPPLENINQWMEDWVAPITDVSVRFQALDEDDINLIVPFALGYGKSDLTPNEKKLPKDVQFKAIATFHRDDGTQIQDEQLFLSTEGLLVTFRFKLHDCKCSYWLSPTWNIGKWLKCLFGGSKRCK